MAGHRGWAGAEREGVEWVGREQRSRGAEEQRSRGAEEQRSRGAEEQRSRGAEEARRVGWVEVGGGGCGAHSMTTVPLLSEMHFIEPARIT